MKYRFSRFIRLAVLLLLLAGNASPASAQCPMCRMSAESNLKNGGTDGRGLNGGILYMLAMPYLVAAGIGFWWWSNRRKQNDPLDQDFEEKVLHEN